MTDKQIMTELEEMTVEEYFNSSPKSIEDFQKRMLFVLQNKEKIYEYLGKIIDDKTN